MPTLAGIFRMGMEGDTGFPRVKVGILGRELQNKEGEVVPSPRAGWGLWGGGVRLVGVWCGSLPLSPGPEQWGK